MGLGFRAEGPGRAFEGLGGRLELSVQGVGLGRKTLKLKPGHNPYALIVSIVDKPANSQYTYPGSV